MPAQPRFSVVIPAFNAEPYLTETIRSVLTQSDPDFELLIVDDGSTDHTAAIAASFEDHRIYALTTPPSGRPAVPRNLAIRHARGEFIAFLDADDRWPANKLATFRNAIDANPQAGLFFSNGFITDSAGRLQHHILPPWNHLAAIPPNDELLALVNYVPLSSVCVRRAGLPERPFDEHLDLRAVEDQLLWLLLNRDMNFHYIPQPLLYKRAHVAGISAARAIQLTPIHALLDTIDALGLHRHELIRLARTLYEVRHCPSLAIRFDTLCEITVALLSQPVRTSRLFAKLAAFVAARKIAPKPPTELEPAPQTPANFATPRA